MSGECDKCGEHALQCVCNIDPSIVLAAAIIAESIQNTQYTLALDAIKQAGLLEEFEVFRLEQGYSCPAFDAMQEFAEQHPDKFYIPEETESYGKFIILD